MKKLPKITALILALSLACGCSEVFPDSNASGKDTSAYTLPPDPVSSEAPSDTEAKKPNSTIPPLPKRYRRILLLKKPPLPKQTALLPKKAPPPQATVI